jgi:uncharacterized OB-fold protein
MVAQYTKPLPAPDPETARFWEGCREHKLLAQKCSSCYAFRWPPRDLCPECRSWDYEWVPLAGTAKVCSFVVVHHVTVPAFADDAPYAVAHVMLDGTDDKVRLTTNIIDCPWEQVRVGMPVTVVFEDVTPEVTLPKFRPT